MGHPIYEVTVTLKVRVYAHNLNHAKLRVEQLSNTNIAPYEGAGIVGNPILKVESLKVESISRLESKGPPVNTKETS